MIDENDMDVDLPKQSRESLETDGNLSGKKRLQQYFSAFRVCVIRPTRHQTNCPSPSLSISFER